MKVIAAIPSNISEEVADEFISFLRKRKVKIYTCLNCFKKYWVFNSIHDKALSENKTIRELEKNSFNKTCPECFNMMYESWEIDTSQINNIVSGGNGFS